jgi:uncharacterized membrane protein
VQPGHVLTSFQTSLNNVSKMLFSILRWADSLIVGGLAAAM